jgi:flagellar protein FliL
MSAAAATADDSAPAKPKSKKMLFIIIGVVVLALVGGGAAFFLMKKNHAAEDGEDGAAAAEAHAPEPPKHDPKAPPTFLPLDAMVVNLADEGGNRFVQLAITLQLTDPKVAEDMKVYMPTIRNGILMLISQRTAEQILKIEGKEELTQEIIGEISGVMGYEYEDPKAEPEAEVKGKKPKRKRAVYNPIQGVLFSSFIVQ